MTREEISQHFGCGTVEQTYENSKWFSVFMQLLFTGVGIYFFWLMLAETTLAAKLDNIAVLIFCLWRIDRQRDIICYVTAKGLVVRRQFMSLEEFLDEQLHPDHNLVFIRYEDIFEISDNWREIQLGAAEEGGLAVLPVHLQFLPRRYKQEIMDRIKKEQEKDDKDDKKE